MNLLNVRKELQTGCLDPASLITSMGNSILENLGESKEVHPPFYKWVENIILDGEPFTWHRHEYLIEPYKDLHTNQVEIKATQMGLTSKALLRVVYSAKYEEKLKKGILYLFPSKTDVTDFSKGRVAPLIKDNPDTVGSWIQDDADSANLKRIAGKNLYLRGMVSVVGLKSIPVDFVVFDELDEAPKNAVDKAMERMSHSEAKWVLKLSNPTLPDYGIDKAFQQTDQRYWLLKCEKCNYYTCLEDTFPECLVRVNGHAIRACQKCGAELNPSVGEWVAKRPDITELRGYHYSQLFSHFVDPLDILNQFHSTNNLTDFHNLKIGNAYVEAQNRLTIEEVLALCGTDGIASSDKGPCFMGVDQGGTKEDKIFYVVIGKKQPSHAGKHVHIAIYKDWDDLDRLMRNFKVILCVVDAQPHLSDAYLFAERHKGKVFLNYYNEHQKGHYAWNEGRHIVTCNRTESLDASHHEVTNEIIVLPKRCDIVELFAEHLHNVAKKLEEDEETGSKRYVYVKLGEDHFRHAYNYEAMARQNGPELLFPNM